MAVVTVAFEAVTTPKNVKAQLQHKEYNHGNDSGLLTSAMTSSANQLAIATNDQQCICTPIFSIYQCTSRILRIMNGFKALEQNTRRHLSTLHLTECATFWNKTKQIGCILGRRIKNSCSDSVIEFFLFVCE